MKNNCNISYKVMEQRYLESAIECLIETKMQSGSIGKDMNLDNNKIISSAKALFNDMSFFKNTIIAVDETKENFVAAILPGQDYCDFIKSLSTPSQDLTFDLLRKIEIMSIQPLLKYNYVYGEFLICKSFGVRKEYENLRIGQQILYKFFEHASSKGYSMFAGFIYNPKSAYITEKHGGQVFSHITLKQIQDIHPYLLVHAKNDIKMIGYFNELTLNPKKHPVACQVPQQSRL